MRLNSWSRSLALVVIALSVFMTMMLGLHWFGEEIVTWGLYSQLFGAFLGGLIVIISVNIPIRFGEESEPWLGQERLAWTLIGLGAIMWGFGETVYRYLLAHDLPSFPALSDVGYSALPLFVFAGLLLQPSSDSGRARLLVVLDSLISMGSILAIAWFLLLGNMAQTPGEADLGKFLGLYYPISDIALLSCVVFLIIRGQGRVYEVTARRVGLVLVAAGLCVFAVSDFNYNIQNNMGTYVDGTWADLGWPIGLMIIGLAAHFRRFIPSTSGDLVEERVRYRSQHVSFGPAEFLPYFLLGALFLVLTFNVLTNDPVQVWNRPVLLVTTLGVVILVIIRQLNTQLENERLSLKQASSLDRLAMANARVEEQARQISEYNTNLEEGIAHLKEVQAQIANGNLRARARITVGNLVSLAGSLNIMADRLLRYEQTDLHAQRLSRALSDLSRAFEISRTAGTFVMPASCNEFPEIQRLLLSLGLKYNQNTPLPEQGLASPAQSGAQRSLSQPLSAPQRAFSQPLSNLPPLPPFPGQSGQRPPSQPLPTSSRPSSQPLPTSPRPSSQPLPNPQRSASFFEPVVPGMYPSSGNQPPITPSPLSAPPEIGDVAPRSSKQRRGPRQPSSNALRPFGAFDEASGDLPPLSPPPWRNE